MSIHQTNRRFPDGKNMEDRMNNMEKKMDQTMIMLQRMSEQITELVMHARGTPHQMAVTRTSRLRKSGANISQLNSMLSHQSPQPVVQAPSGLQTFQITVDHDSQAGEYLHFLLE